MHPVSVEAKGGVEHLALGPPGGTREAMARSCTPTSLLWRLTCVNVLPEVFPEVFVVVVVVVGGGGGVCVCVCV